MRLTPAHCRQVDVVRSLAPEFEHAVEQETEASIIRWLRGIGHTEAANDLAYLHVESAWHLGLEPLIYCIDDRPRCQKDPNICRVAYCDFPRCLSEQ